MKKINPKIFWSIFIFVVSVIGGLIFVMIGVAIAFVFWISLIIGVIVFYPFLPHMPVVLNFFLREYELECNILRVLNMVRFDTKRKMGWMTRPEISYAVEKMSDRQTGITDMFVALNKLRKEGAIVSQHVPVEYLKEPSKRVKNTGFGLAFRLKDDSKYKPRKPKWLPKEEKKKKVVLGGITAH